MGRIHLLDEAVIHKIAAGEVVQRPAFALKELIENSLDAGAGRIVVRLEQMGKRLLEVEDDGEGMSRTDALMCIERHATSKIRDEQDIFRVTTLGFRGEALPSIAAVSRMLIRTQRPEDEAGTEIFLDGGHIRQVKECGMVPGTVIQVRDIFYNTPARRRFMKSDKTEGFHLFRTLYALSLVNLTVQFEVIQDKQRVLNLPPVSKVEERLAHLWSDLLNQPMALVDSYYKGARLWGLAAKPPFTRVRGRGIFFFLNRRWVTDRRILRAVLSAYHAVAPKGFIPDGVLYLEMPPSLVDVNVHPSKFEVRLSQEAEMLSWIQKTVALHLSVVPNPVRSAFEEMVVEGSNNRMREQGFGSMAVSEGGTGSSSPSASPIVAAPSVPTYTPGRKDILRPSGWSERGSAIPDEYRVLGVVANTYIVCASAEGIFIVDKHAAHERLIFERLKRAYGDRIPSQRCLFPVILSLDQGEALLAEAVAPYLKRMGIVLEPFGEGAMRVVSLPRWVRQEEAEKLVRALLREFSEMPALEGLSEKTDKFLATIACHSASRGQDKVSVPEAYSLLDQIRAEMVPLSCPHGRTFVHFISLKDLERLFER